MTEKKRNGVRKWGWPSTPGSPSLPLHSITAMHPQIDSRRHPHPYQATGEQEMAEIKPVEAKF